jgi:hypothetical protein
MEMEMGFCWDIPKESAPCVASIKDGGIVHRKQAHGRRGRRSVGKLASIKREREMNSYRDLGVCLLDRGAVAALVLHGDGAASPPLPLMRSTLWPAAEMLSAIGRSNARS